MKSVAVIGTALMDTLLVSPSVVHEETCNKVRYFEADGDRCAMWRITVHYLEFRPFFGRSSETTSLLCK